MRRTPDLPSDEGYEGQLDDEQSCCHLQKRRIAQAIPCKAQDHANVSAAPHVLAGRLRQHTLRHAPGLESIGRLGPFFRASKGRAHPLDEVAEFNVPGLTVPRQNRFERVRLGQLARIQLIADFAGAWVRV